MIGLLAGITYMTWSYLIERLKVDDPLDAVAGIIKIIKLNILNDDHHKFLNLIVIKKSIYRIALLKFNVTIVSIFM